MTDRIYSPFSQATREAFKLLLDLDVDTGAPQFLDSVLDTENKLNIIIGLKGDLCGRILYRFPKETALEMVQIMSGMEIDAVDEFVTSAMGEIANTIGGNAVTGLSEQRIACDIEPPHVLIDELPEAFRFAPSMRAKVKTPVGEVELDIQINE